MKHLNLLIISILLCANTWAQNDKTSVRIVGQNMQNYFLTLTNSFSSCSTMAQLEAKTNKIVHTFSETEADIFALCELEVSDTVVGYLTEAMNKADQSRPYAYVKDGLLDSSDGATKAGFIYNRNTVRPVGTNHASTNGFYRYRMRWQAFEVIATQECFVVSMNHFKAKSGSDDSTTNQSRMYNARDLYNAMSAMQRVDEDIIVMGDLNCQVDEEPIQYLINTAGLEEQLLRFHPDAYTHRYYSSKELIDHIMVNSSAREMVTNANVSHGNTSNSAYRFSDHDTYWVDLETEQLTGTNLPNAEPKQTARKVLINGQIYIIRDNIQYNIMGINSGEMRTVNDVVTEW